MATDRIIRWRFLLEEYGATFEHVPGTKNIVADALSRLDADFDNRHGTALDKIRNGTPLFSYRGNQKKRISPKSCINCKIPTQAQNP
jgi:hypothetical protein